MVDSGSGRSLPVTGEALRGLSEVEMIHVWLGRSDEGAFTGIVAQVSASSTDEVDRLDAALLSLAKASPDSDLRMRLIKFYAFFKIVEMQRYREFRGFPQ
jgi:hypothetical protein